MRKGRCIVFLFAFLALLPLGRAEEPPPRVQNLTGQVQLEFQRHNYKKVIKLYKDFIEKYPDQFLPLRIKVYYSESLADTGDLDESITILKEILSRFPQQVDYLKLQYDLANLLFMQRRYEDAKTAYQKVLLQASHHQEILSKARERLALMKDKEGKKKDVVSLQLIDIETTLESSEIPDGAEAILQEILQQQPPENPQALQAKRLLEKVKEVKTKKAASLLDEARRLFDEERKYVEVRQILEQIKKDYADVGDLQSVELLLKEVDRRLGRVTP